MPPQPLEETAPPRDVGFFPGTPRQGPSLTAATASFTIEQPDRVFVLRPVTSAQRDQILERIALEATTGNITTARFQEPGRTSVGRLMLVGEVTEHDDFRVTLQVKGPLTPDAEWTQMSLGEFFTRATEVNFKAEMPRRARINVSELTSEQRQRYANAWVKWVNEGHILDEHVKWHAVHGSGGTQGATSGEALLQFHGRLLEDFKQHLRDTGQGDLLDASGGELPVWDTLQDLPEEFAFPDMGAKNIGWSPPAWLTKEGSNYTVTLFGRPFSRLGDFRTLDELGQYIGANVHGVGHAGLGGQMTGHNSVGVAPFMLWHEVIENIRREWLTTENGQRWLAAHPSGWTDSLAEHQH